MHTDFLDENGKWKCIKCGACCRNVTNVLPEFDSGNGVCVNLKDGMCDIYDSRPAVCRTEGKVFNDMALAMACDIMKRDYAV